MTLSESWDWFQSFTNLEKVQSATKRTWRLDRMNALLADRSHPERQGLSIHLAGSKGKGSTAAYLSSIFTAAGHSTGLYASPHVLDWRERITRNGAFFSDAAYTAAADRLRSYWDGMDPTRRQTFVDTWGGEPTTFEWLTLAAFELFTAENVDARVWETGLGGRLDATNTQTPSAVVLTLIELEHTDILGDTRTLIAGEKAGILKPGVPAFVAPQPMDALEVFRDRARSIGAPLRVFDEEVDEFDTTVTREGTLVHLALSRGPTLSAQLPLLGHAQGLNAAVSAWTALSLGFGLDVVKQGLESTRLPGRLQVLSRSPWTILDGAHTAESVKLLVRSWLELWGPGGTLVFGAFEGKAIGPMASQLAPHFSRVIVTKPGTFRPSDPEALRQAFVAAGAPPAAVTIAPGPAEALAEAQSSGRPVLVTGSFYLVGEILSSLPH